MTRLLVVLVSLISLPATLAAAEENSFPDGSTVKVKWKESWYDATIKSRDAGKACWNVHYAGYADSWDECVDASRIQGAARPNPYPDGTGVKVKWKGSWYDATIKSRNTGKDCWNIHYDGYGDNWDECVKAGRIKGR